MQTKKARVRNARLNMSLNSSRICTAGNRKENFLQGPYFRTPLMILKKKLAMVSSSEDGWVLVFKGKELEVQREMGI